MQLSLGRRVALKVLPLAGALDPRQLQRFNNKAQAAADLHHPHIVPVYAVGCERGVHYYAMQFIDGPDAGAVVAARARGGAPQRGAEPHRRDAARHRRLGARDPAACRHRRPSTERPRTAHSSARSPSWASRRRRRWSTPTQLGIIHRDVKPANLLVDARGNLWVTDFGLARFQSDAGLTMTGDLVGTLRYMSPEQALAAAASSTTAPTSTRWARRCTSC